MPSRAVIFDMDGLLIDSEPLWKQAEKRAFSKLGITLTPEMGHETIGMRCQEMVAFWLNKFNVKANVMAVVTDIVDRVKFLIISEGKLKIGVDYILQFFFAKHYKIAIASSSPAILIKTVINKFQFEHYITCIVSAGNCVKGKPHPEIYVKTANNLDVSTNECIVFEDSYRGILAAKSAGMKVVWVPDLTVADGLAQAKNIHDIKIPTLKYFSEPHIKKLYQSSAIA